MVMESDPATISTTTPLRLRFSSATAISLSPHARPKSEQRRRLPYSKTESEKVQSGLDSRTVGSKWVGLITMSA